MESSEEKEFLVSYSCIAEKLSGLFTIATVQGLVLGLILRVELHRWGNWSLQDLFISISGVVAACGFLVSIIAVAPPICRNPGLSPLHKIIIFILFYPTIFGVTIAVVSTVKSFELSL